MKCFKIFFSSMPQKNMCLIDTHDVKSLERVKNYLFRHYKDIPINVVKQHHYMFKMNCLRTALRTVN